MNMNGPSFSNRSAGNDGKRCLSSAGHRSHSRASSFIFPSIAIPTLARVAGTGDGVMRHLTRLIPTTSERDAVAPKDAA